MGKPAIDKTVRLSEEINAEEHCMYSLGIQGVIYEKMGDYKKAIACFEKALSYKTRSNYAILHRTCSYEELGYIYIKLGDLERAEALFLLQLLNGTLSRLCKYSKT